MSNLTAGSPFGQRFWVAYVHAFLDFVRVFDLACLLFGILLILIFTHMHFDLRSFDLIFYSSWEQASCTTRKLRCSFRLLEAAAASAAAASQIKDSFFYFYRPALAGRIREALKASRYIYWGGPLGASLMYIK